MPIDPLPSPPPTRQDPENFAARGDAFMAALPPFALQAEAARQEIVAAEASVAAAAPAAIAAANYRGEYNPATTYSVGESVSHSGDRWAAKQTALNKTPSDGSAYWLRITAIPPQAGQAGKYLTTDGSLPAWGVPVKSGYQEFTASNGAWPKPADATWIAVHCIAGGGGGASSSSGYSYAGAGGEGWFFIFRAADLPSAIPIVVGAGGAKGASDGASGGAGGDSSFNGRLALGGAGGAGTGGGTDTLVMMRGTGSQSVASLGTARAIVAASETGLTAFGRAGRSIYGGGGGYGGASVFAGSGSTTSTAGVLGAGGSGGTSRPRSDGGDGAVRVWWW